MLQLFYFVYAACGVVFATIDSCVLRENDKTTEGTGIVGH